MAPVSLEENLNWETHVWLGEHKPQYDPNAALGSCQLPLTLDLLSIGTSYYVTGGDVFAALLAGSQLGGIVRDMPGTAWEGDDDEEWGITVEAPEVPEHHTHVPHRDEGAKFVSLSPADEALQSAPTTEIAGTLTGTAIFKAKRAIASRLGTWVAQRAGTWTFGPWIGGFATAASLLWSFMPPTETKQNLFITPEYV